MVGLNLNLVTVSIEITFKLLEITLLLRCMLKWYIETNFVRRNRLIRNIIS